MLKQFALQTMKKRAYDWSPDIRQIDLDVNRTYRNHITFWKRFDVKYVTDLTFPSLSFAAEEHLFYLFINLFGEHKVRKSVSKT